MPLKVIGAGLGRTGTLSLKAALEQLGFAKCYHMVEVVAHPAHARVWENAADGKPVDWEALFDGYLAAVDWPVCGFYAELAALYPEAKVILTVRDAERWYESVRQTIHMVQGAFPRWILLWNPRMRRILALTNKVIWSGSGMFEGRFEDRTFALEVFRRHADEVRQAIPAERLLVYDVAEGWGPLCAFLGVPVPADRRFPHVNDTREFRTRVRRAWWIIQLNAWVTIILALVLGAWLAGIIAR